MENTAKGKEGQKNCIWFLKGKIYVKNPLGSNRDEEKSVSSFHEKRAVFELQVLNSQVCSLYLVFS